MDGEISLRQRRVARCTLILGLSGDCYALFIGIEKLQQPKSPTVTIMAIQTVFLNTVPRALFHRSLRSWWPKQVAALTARHRQHWAHKHRNWIIEEWEKVAWSDITFSGPSDPTAACEYADFQRRNLSFCMYSWLETSVVLLVCTPCLFDANFLR